MIASRLSLAEEVRAGHRLALARLLTQVENDTPNGQTGLNALFPYTGQAHLIGITGAPGTGKSTLVNQLARYYRHPPAGQEPQKVGILAVDPSSPFSGGAVLGDRVRMRDLAGDPGVFIRSMASRGALGGIAHTTAALAQVLDAAGFGIILIETVGAGQTEVEVARLAHTTLVVEAPGLGDDIQAIKAGILEIADILVVNKADRPGAESTERVLCSMLEMAHPAHKGTFYSFQPYPLFQGEKALPRFREKPEDRVEVWVPPVVRTIATQGAGLVELGSAIGRHAAYLRQSGEWQRREAARIQAELYDLLRDALVRRWQAATPSEVYTQTLEALCQREIGPHEALARLLKTK